MAYTIDELYKDIIKPNKKRTCDRNYITEKNRLNQKYETLRETLVDEHTQKALDSLVRCSYSLAEKDNVRFFVNGFKLGLSLSGENL